MDKFTTLKSRAAYLDLVNIDTDMIIPKQFLKTIKKLQSQLQIDSKYFYNKELNILNRYKI